MAKQPGALPRPRSHVPSAAQVARFAALNVIMASRRLSPARAKLWVVIHGFSRSTRGCFLGAEGLAFRAGMTVKGVYSALDWLAAQGLLEVVSRGRGRSCSRYAVLPLAAVPTGCDRESVEKSVRVLDALLPEPGRKGQPSPRGSRESTARAVGSIRREKVPKTFSLYRDHRENTEQAVPPRGERLAPEQVKQMFRRAAARAREVAP